MIIIDHAVLHILDFNSGVTVFSDQELPLENSVESFLLKHIEKSYQDQGLKSGKFYEDSVCKSKVTEYVSGGELSFIAFSRWLAEAMYANIARSEQLESADLLVADARIDEERFIVLFKCNNKIGFIHQVTQGEAGICNEIINHYAILPNLSQRMDECAFIDSAKGDVRFIDKKYAVEGEHLSILADCILECAYTASPKTTLAQMTAIAKKVAENHGQDTVAAVTAAKSCIAENVQTAQYLEPAELGRKIFQASPALQEEYIAEVQNAGLPTQVEVEPEFALKKTKMHKIKTDTGIELSIPLDYYQNTDYVEFINHTNGTISINLKNIMNLINK